MQVSSNQNDAFVFHKSNLSNMAENLKLLMKVSPIPGEKYIKLMQEVKELFTSPSFLVPAFSQLRKDFFSQISETVFQYAKICIANEIQSLEDYRIKVKFPYIILFIVFTQLLEVKEALPSDFILMLNYYYGNQSSEVYIPYLTTLHMLINEIDQEDIDYDDTVSTLSESSEGVMNKKITLTNLTITDFFDSQGLQLIVFPVEVLKKLSQIQVTKDSFSIIEISLRIIIRIIKNLSINVKKQFSSTYKSSFVLILSSFLSVIKSSLPLKEQYTKSVANMFEFCELLTKSLDPPQHYILLKENLEYILKHFNFNNDMMDFYDFNIWCIDFLISISPFYMNKQENLQAYPLIVDLFKQSTKINLITFEDQINSLFVWSHFLNQILYAYDPQTNQIAANEIANLTILNSPFLEALEFNIQFIFQGQVNISEFEDISHFAEELSQLIILSNLIDSRIFVELIKSLGAIQSKCILLYYTLQKFLMKKYLQFHEKLSQIYKIFGKHEEFLLLSKILFESFSIAQKNFNILDMQTIEKIESQTHFVQDIGSKIFNIKTSNLDQSGVLPLFMQHIINPMVLLNQAIFQKLPESLIQLNEIQFSQLCTMMSSVCYFACPDNRKNIDYIQVKQKLKKVFQLELDVSLIQKIISFKNALNLDQSFWISPESKSQRKKIKQFYFSTIYWIIFSSVSLENSQAIFENYFFPKVLNICILQSVLKKLDDKILPNTFLLYLSTYFKSLTETNGFTEGIYEEKIRKLMVIISKSIPSDLHVDYSKIEYYISLYLNQECQWLRYYAFSDEQLKLIQQENKFYFIHSCFIILQDILQIVQKYPKFYSEKTIMGLKRNFFLNRMFWIILKCSSILSKEQIQENSLMITTIQSYISFALKKNTDFLESEENPQENSHYFNFILDNLTQSPTANKKTALDFCQKILSYFKEDSYNQNILNLAQTSELFQKITLQLFNKTWESIFNYCSNSIESIDDFKERDIGQTIDFTLKFAKCLQGNMTVLHENIMLSIKNHPFYSPNYQVIYNTIIENFVFKDIDGVRVLQNVFLKSIIKDLFIWASKVKASHPQN